MSVVIYGLHAVRRVGNAEPGPEEFLELFQADAKHILEYSMPMPNLELSEITQIQRAIIFITQESISCAYAQHRLHMHRVCFAEIFLKPSLKQASHEQMSYALLTHFTVVAAVTRRSKRIAAKLDGPCFAHASRML